MPDPATPMRWMRSGFVGVGEALGEKWFMRLDGGFMAVQTRSAASRKGECAGGFCHLLVALASPGESRWPWQPILRRPIALLDEFRPAGSAKTSALRFWWSSGPHNGRARGSMDGRHIAFP